MLEPQHYADDTVSLQQYLAVVRRRWWVIAATALVVLIAGSILTAMTEPSYEARAKLIVRAAPATVSSVNTENPLIGLLSMAQPEPLKVQLEWLNSTGFRWEVLTRARAPRGSRPRIRFSGDSETNSITIKTTSANPHVAARVANAAVEQYLQRTQDLSLQGIRLAQSFVDKEALRARQELQRAEDALLDYRRSSGVAEIAAEKEARARDLATTETQYRQVQTDTIRVQAQLQALRAQVGLQPRELAVETLQANPRHSGFQAKLTEIQADRDVLLQSHRPESMRVRALDAQIASLQSRLEREPEHLTITRRDVNSRREQLLGVIDGYEAELNGLRAQRAQLVQQLRQHRRSLPQTQGGPAEVQLAQLQRDRDMAEKSYLLLAGKLEDLKIRESAREQSARVLERAYAPLTPTSPQPARNLLLALFVGVMLGCCLGVVLEYLDDRVTAPEQVERLLMLPVLGAIPSIAGSRRLMHALPPYCAAAECYRGLRSAVSFASADGPLGSIGVTSTRMGEGKTLTAVNLALSMAIDGRKVILVDADLRRPRMHEVLDLRPSPGLTDVLAGHCSLDQALQAVPDHGILVLTSGPIPTHPAELLNTAGMQSLIEQLQKRAELVIFDTPPCVPFTDAQVLGTKLDGMLLVAAVGEARRSDLQRARELLEQARIRVLGVVANKASRGRSRSYARYTGRRGDASGNGFPRGNGYHAPEELLPDRAGEPPEPETRSRSR